MSLIENAELIMQMDPDQLRLPRDHLQFLGLHRQIVFPGPLPAALALLHRLLLATTAGDAASYGDDDESPSRFLQWSILDEVDVFLPCPLLESGISGLLRPDAAAAAHKAARDVDGWRSAEAQRHQQQREIDERGALRFRTTCVVGGLVDDEHYGLGALARELKDIQQLQAKPRRAAIATSLLADAVEPFAALSDQMCKMGMDLRAGRECQEAQLSLQEAVKLLRKRSEKAAKLKKVLKLNNLERDESLRKALERAEKTIDEYAELCSSERAKETLEAYKESMMLAEREFGSVLKACSEKAEDPDPRLVDIAFGPLATYVPVEPARIVFDALKELFTRTKEEKFRLLTGFYKKMEEASTLMSSTDPDTDGDPLDPNPGSRVPTSSIYRLLLSFEHKKLSSSMDHVVQSYIAKLEQSAPDMAELRSQVWEEICQSLRRLAAHVLKKPRGREREEALGRSVELAKFRGSIRDKAFDLADSVHKAFARLKSYSSEHYQELREIIVPALFYGNVKSCISVYQRLEEDGFLSDAAGIPVHAEQVQKLRETFRSLMAQEFFKNDLYDTTNENESVYGQENDKEEAHRDGAKCENEACSRPLPPDRLVSIKIAGADPSDAKELGVCRPCAMYYEKKGVLRNRAMELRRLRDERRALLRRLGVRTEEKSQQSPAAGGEGDAAVAAADTLPATAPCSCRHHWCALRFGV
eukprot:tig00020938_g16149.t1